jgi:Ca-activated chloride channel family protein
VRRPLLLLLAAGIAAVVLSGPEAAGRLALRAGLPGAAALLSDPAARGLALYRSGDHAAADAALADAGRRQTFNRALTLAATGRHALSVAYLDAVLFANPADAEAQRVRDLVDRLVPKVVGESVAPGRLAAVGGIADPAAAGGAFASTPDPEWKKPIEARGFVASDAWLETITDDPGEFLRLRLEKEHERRAGLGLIRPAEGERW